MTASPARKTRRGSSRMTRGSLMATRRGLARMTAGPAPKTRRGFTRVTRGSFHGHGTRIVADNGGSSPEDETRICADDTRIPSWPRDADRRGWGRVPDANTRRKFRGIHADLLGSWPWRPTRLRGTPRDAGPRAGDWIGRSPGIASHLEASRGLRFWRPPDPDRASRGPAVCARSVRSAMIRVDPRFVRSWRPPPCVPDSRPGAGEWRAPPAPF